MAPIRIRENISNRCGKRRKICINMRNVFSCFIVYQSRLVSVSKGVIVVEAVGTANDLMCLQS